MIWTLQDLEKKSERCIDEKKGEMREMREQMERKEEKKTQDGEIRAEGGRVREQDKARHKSGTS